MGATRSGMDEDSKGQRKMEDSGGGLLPAVKGHNSLEYNRINKNFVNVNVIVNFKKQMCIPLKPIPNEDTLPSLTFLLTGQQAGG